jgi:hypothetical protein
MMLCKALVKWCQLVRTSVLSKKRCCFGGSQMVWQRLVIGEAAMVTCYKNRMSSIGADDTSG